MLTIIRTLHERVIDTSSREDQATMAALRDKCRVITEPLLIEVAATVGGRSGTLYITLEHLYFHSAGGLFASMYMKLQPIRTLVSVSKGPPSNKALAAAIEAAGVAASIVGSGMIGSAASGVVPPSDSIVLVDEGGQVTSVEISGPTADYCGRICDLVMLLKHVRHCGMVLNPYSYSLLSFVSWNHQTHWRDIVFSILFESVSNLITVFSHSV